MNTENVVTEQMILNNLNQCTTETWKTNRVQMMFENPYLK